MGGGGGPDPAKNTGRSLVWPPNTHPGKPTTLPRMVHGPLKIRAGGGQFTSHQPDVVSMFLRSGILVAIVSEKYPAGD